MAAGGTPAAPCTMLNDCNHRGPLLLTPSDGFDHLSIHNDDEDPIKDGPEGNQVKQIVTPETGSIVFSEQIVQKTSLKPARPTSQAQTQKRPTIVGVEKHQSPPPTPQTASALKVSQECHEEFNRMRERLFRMLSKVPIQVATQMQQAHEPTAGAYCQDTSSTFASSSSSSVTCSTSSTSSSAGGSRHNHHQQHQQHQHKPVIDREPLIIKYYHERSLEEVLELHFRCSLIKHHQNDSGAHVRFGAHEQLADHQTYGPQVFNHHQELSIASAQPSQDQYQQQPQFGVEQQQQGWQAPFATNLTGADYSWHPYDANGGFFNNNNNTNNNNKITSSTAIASNGNDKCNRANNRRAKDNIATTNGRHAGGLSRQATAKRVRAKRSSNSGLMSQPRAMSSSLLQPASNSAPNAGAGQQHQQHLASPVAAVFNANDFHQPNQYAGHHNHLYTYQSPVDTSVGSTVGMLSFNQVAPSEATFVGQGELASGACGHHYSEEPHQSHQHQQLGGSTNYYQPTADVIYQQAQAHPGNLYTSPVSLEAPNVSEHHHHHFQQHQQHHHSHQQLQHQQHHHQHQHQHQHHHQQQQPMIEQQPDYVATGTDLEPHRIAFYPQTGTDSVNGASYVFTPQSASLGYSGQQPGGRLELVGDGPLGPAPNKWQTSTAVCRQSQSQ